MSFTVGTGSWLRKLYTGMNKSWLAVTAEDAAGFLTIDRESDEYTPTADTNSWKMARPLHIHRDLLTPPDFLGELASGEEVAIEGRHARVFARGAESRSRRNSPILNCRTPLQRCRHALGGTPRGSTFTYAVDFG